MTTQAKNDAIKKPLLNVQDQVSEDSANCKEIILETRKI